eukprot:m.180815 g.180815  ORF g.180815 m.180815 type:complete len:167 (+) comp18434_c0_seq5:219-719(+)
MAESQKNLCSLCGKESKNRCAGCKRIFYCSAECQRSHWKTHKKDCKFYQQSDKDTAAGDILSSQEKMMKQHKEEFDRICKHYGLNRGKKAEALAAFLTGSDGGSDGDKITPQMMKDKFDMEEGDAKTFLSWIHLGVQFKKEHIDGSAEALAQLKESKDAALFGVKK